MVFWELLLGQISVSRSCLWRWNCGGRCEWRAGQALGLLGGWESQAGGLLVFKPEGFPKVARARVCYFYFRQDRYNSGQKCCLSVSETSACFIQMIRQLPRCPFLEQVSASQPITALRDLGLNYVSCHGLPFPNHLCCWWHVPLKHLGSAGRDAVVWWQVGATCSGESSGHCVPVLTAA